MVKKSNFKKAIILGGSKGIGKAIALELRKSCKNIHALSTSASVICSCVFVFEGGIGECVHVSTCTLHTWLTSVWSV